MKKYLLLLLVLIPFKVYAEEAIELTKECSYLVNDTSVTKLSDNNYKTSINLDGGQNLLIHDKEGKIKQLYIVYEIAPKTGIVLLDDGSKTVIGKDGFLHEYVNLDTFSQNITLTYDEKVTISEIRVFSDGDTPLEIQKWVKEDTTDLMIFSTHADDEQLFFAGVMPTYINIGKKVHVVYLARHDVGAYYMPSRLHEQLDGLWTLGVTDYPTFGLIPDAYSESLSVAESQMNQAGYTDDDVIRFDVEQIRKYKPKVVLGHDENGEYGHGQHRLNTHTLKKAVSLAADSSYQIEGLDPYSIPKVYLHLYDMDNKTVLDYDIPLDKYNGKTAYEVSKEGYSKHLSQQYTWFTAWLNGKNNSYTSATQINKYNPAYWGLYKTDVGPDVNKNDLFENIVEEKKEENKENIKIEDKAIITERSRDFYNKYKDQLIIISGSVVIIGIILIVILKRKKN